MDESQQPAAGWWMASDGNWYPPDLATQPTEPTAPAPAPSVELDLEPSTQNSWMIKEDGRNGSVILTGPALVRTFKRRLGKDDVMTIPLRSITSVHLDRRSLGTDVVTVTSGHAGHQWKVKDAETFVSRLNECILS